MIIITFIISSAIISIGVHLKFYDISFKKILTVVAWSNLIFLLPKIIKIIYFLFFKESFTIEDYRNFHPFSLLYFIDKETIASWFYYPIYLINIFEFIYWFMLAYGIKLVSQLSFVKSLILIFQTYFIALLFWAIFVVFIAVSI